MKDGEDLYKNYWKYSDLLSICICDPYWAVIHKLTGSISPSPTYST